MYSLPLSHQGSPNIYLLWNLFDKHSWGQRGYIFKIKKKKYRFKFLHSKEMGLLNFSGFRKIICCIHHMFPITSKEFYNQMHQHIYTSLVDTTEWLHFHFPLSCIEEGNGNPLRCSCLKNPRDGGASWAAIYGVTQSWTRLKQQQQLVAQLVESLPAMRETWIRSLGWEDPLEKRTATHSSILAWKIPWIVQSMGSQRVGHDWVTFISLQYIYSKIYDYTMWIM